MISSEMLQKLEEVQALCSTMTETINELPPVKEELQFMPRWEYGTLYDGYFDGDKFIDNNGKEYSPYMDVSRWKL